MIAEASNGEEAYQNYVRTVPDLVTMDVTMPILNGLEAVKKIKASFADACIIAIDNKNGIFIVSVYPALNEAAMSSIKIAIQGFLFIKPLKVVFNFELENLTDIELQSFSEAMLAIKEADGNVC